MTAEQTAEQVEQPAHGEPGHVCGPAPFFDAGDFEGPEANLQAMLTGGRPYILVVLDLEADGYGVELRVGGGLSKPGTVREILANIAQSIGDAGDTPQPQPATDAAGAPL